MHTNPDEHDLGRRIAHGHRCIRRLLNDVMAMREGGEVSNFEGKKAIKMDKPRKGYQEACRVLFIFFIHGIFESLACREFDGFDGGNLNLFASAWITANACSTFT